MNYTYLILLLFLVAACNTPQNSTPQSSFQLNGDTAIIPANSNLNGKIKLLKVTNESYSQQHTATGVVKAIPNNFAQIASPFSGRITRSFVKLGQQVGVNAPIFEISAPSFFDAGKAYYQAKQEMDLAEKNLKRQKDLLKNGVGIQKDVDESEVTFELAKRDFENAVASLKVYHVNPAEMVLGQPLIIRSPIAGEVVSNNIVLGQYLRDDAGPVVIVAELGKVWVVGQLKEKDIHKIQEEDQVQIEAAGMPGLLIPGKVYHISEMLDESTRSVEVFIECENKGHNLRPGMFATVQFNEPANSVILIPSQAVLQLENSGYVYVKCGEGRFVKRSVQLGGTDHDKVIVRSGLQGGEEIISEGGFYLLDIK